MKCIYFSIIARYAGDNRLCTSTEPVVNSVIKYTDMNDLFTKLNIFFENN